MEPALPDAGLPGRLAQPATGQLGGEDHRFSTQPGKLLHAAGIAPPAPGARYQSTAASQLQVQALQAMERQAAEADGVLDLQAKVQEAEKQLKQLDANIAAEESGHQKLLVEETEFNSGKDPLSQQIIDLQASALEKEPLATLYRRAKATPPPEDDVLVGRIHQLSQRQEQIVDEIQSLNAILQEQQKKPG